MYDPFAQFTKNVLDNGLEVHSVFWDRSWVRVEIVVHSGGREDPIGKSGLAHFLEHVVGDNIPNRKRSECKKFFESVGGHVDFGSTRYSSTHYNFVIPANLATFREALSILGSMLLGAQIQNGIEHEREIILREFNEKYPITETLEWDMGIRKALFKGHRLETWNRPLGMPEDFLLVTQADLQGFYDRHYVPANIGVVVVGGFQPEEVRAELQKSPFGIKKDGERNSIPKPFNQIIPPVQNSRTVKLSEQISLKREVTTYTATWAFPCSFPQQSRSMFRRMLHTILFDEIRSKRALAYGVSVYLNNFQDVQEWTISASVNPDHTQNIDEIVQDCIVLVSSKQDIFEETLEFLKQDCLMVDVSGKNFVRESADELMLHHRIVPMAEWRSGFENVTFQQMIEGVDILSAEKKYSLILAP